MRSTPIDAPSGSTARCDMEAAAPPGPVVSHPRGVNPCGPPLRGGAGLGPFELGP
jgi:hypothetical protein